MLDYYKADCYRLYDVLRQYAIEISQVKNIQTAPETEIKFLFQVDE